MRILLSFLLAVVLAPNHERQTGEISHTNNEADTQCIVKKNELIQAPPTDVLAELISKEIIQLSEEQIARLNTQVKIRIDISNSGSLLSSNLIASTGNANIDRSIVDWSKSLKFLEKECGKLGGRVATLPLDITPMLSPPKPQLCLSGSKEEMVAAYFETLKDPNSSYLSSSAVASLEYNEKGEVTKAWLTNSTAHANLDVAIIKYLRSSKVCTKGRAGFGRLPIIFAQE